MELYWMGLSCLSRFSSLIIIAWASNSIHIHFHIHQMNDEDDHASQVALARTNLYSIQPRLSIDAVRSMMGLWLMRHFDDIEDAFGFFYLGNTSGEN